MKDELSTIGGFEQMSGLLTRQDGVPNLIEDEPELTEEELQAKLEEDEKSEEEDTDGNEETDESEETDDSGEEEDTEDEEQEETDTDEDTGDEDLPDLAEAEPEIAKYVAEQLEEETGVSFKDLDIKSIKDVVDRLAAVVEESSKPNYSSDEMQKLDDFVREGGNLRDFFNQTISSRIDPDNVDLEIEENQRAVIREHLRNQGYKDERINKYIERYEDAETLSDEATDALELVKEYNTHQKETLLNDQKKEAVEIQKQQQKFFSDVENSIKALDNVRGIKISDKQKNELLNYIFKPNEEGITNYQKEYASSVTNLIESAFFTKEKDSFFEKVQQKAESDAYKLLQKKIRLSKAKRTKTSQEQEDVTSSGLSMLGKELFKQPE